MGDSPIVEADNIKRCHRQTMTHGRCRITWASWLVVVVEKEGCGLLMMPKLSIGVC